MGDNPHRRGGILMLMIAWVLLFGGAYWYFEVRLTHNANPNRAEVLALQHGEVRLQRNQDGHYLAQGEINGQRVTFLVDTGATRVAMSPGLAESLPWLVDWRSRFKLRMAPPALTRPVCKPCSWGQSRCMMWQH